MLTKTWAKRLFCLLLLSIIPIRLTALANPDPAVVKEKLVNMEAAVQDMMRQSKIPGLSVAVFTKDEIIYAKGFGVKNQNTGEAVDPGTVFEAASLSKPITAYVAMKLVEKKRLSLDRPLAKYLKIPYLDDRKAAAKITLRMVLNHTSGLPNEPVGSDRKVYFTPGDHFSYSGGGFRYVQTVLEAVTKAPFEEYMDQELLKPLGMSRSSFVYRKDLASNMAFGHQNETVIPLRFISALAAGSLLSTPSDLARFGMELCDPTLLQEKTVAGMLTPSIKITETYSWGLGIGLCRTSAGDIAWQWGDNMIYQNMMAILPKEQCGVVVMTNSSNGLQITTPIVVMLLNCCLENPIDLTKLESFPF